METKTCSRCKVEKPIDRYSKRSDRPSGVQSKCKDCEREVRVKYYKPHHDTRRKLKISDELYEQLMNNTNCNICNVKLTKKCIDHDHKTMQVRGVLCNNCNTALGLVGDNIQTLKTMVEYLQNTYTNG